MSVARGDAATSVPSLPDTAPPPVTTRARILGLVRALDKDRIVEFGLFLGSVLTLQGTRFTFTLLVAASLHPSDFTSWAQFITFIGYAPIVLLGVANGMNRLVPILRGRGDESEADAVEGATWLAVGIVLLLVVPLGLVLVGGGESLWLGIALLAGALMTVYQVQQFAMRSRLMFNRASAQQWVWACAVGAAIPLLLLFRGSLTATLWIFTGTMAIGVATGAGIRRPTLTHPSLARLWRLLAMGFPIMLSGFLGTLFYTADRWVAAARLDAAAAGAYGLASLIASAIFLVPTVIAQQQYPRLAMLFGAHSSGAVLHAAARRQSLIAALASLGTAVGVAAFALIVVPVFLPAYKGATAPTIILSVGIAALAGSTGYGNLLIVLGAQWLYLIVQGLCFAAAMGLMFIGSSWAGPAGLAAGFGASQAILTVALMFTARVMVARRAAR